MQMAVTTYRTSAGLGPVDQTVKSAPGDYGVTEGVDRNDRIDGILSSSGDIISLLKMAHTGVASSATANRIEIPVEDGKSDNYSSLSRACSSCILVRVEIDRGRSNWIRCIRIGK